MRDSYIILECARTRGAAPREFKCAAAFGTSRIRLDKHNDRLSPSLSHCRLDVSLLVESLLKGLCLRNAAKSLSRCFPLAE